MKICFIGYGAMAKAIARGLLKEGKHQLTASAPSLTPGLTEEGIHTFNDNKKAIVGADVIILAVKPMKMNKVIEALKPPPTGLVISVAAGISLSWFKAQGLEIPIIRTMPNMPCAIGLGATPLIANEFVTPAHKAMAQTIFSCIGLTTWAQKEEDIDSFTALSGSGPAYVFSFLEALVSAAVSLGLNKETATSFALQTLKGAVALAEQSDLELSQLKAKVTSKGGTTEAALKVLEPQLQELILKAMCAAQTRSIELGIQSCQD